MHKKIFSLFLALSFSSTSITHSISVDDVINFGEYLAVSAIFYTAGIYGAKETILDIGYPYIDLKETLNQEKKELELYAKQNNTKLSLQELNFFAFTQALHHAPREYWREIMAGSASLICLYLGTKNLKRALHYL